MGDWKNKLLLSVQCNIAAPNIYISVQSSYSPVEEQAKDINGRTEFSEWTEHRQTSRKIDGWRFC